MSVAEINGIEIYYEVKGEGPPLMLLPGLGRGTSYFDAIEPLVFSILAARTPDDIEKEVEIYTEKLDNLQQLLGVTLSLDKHQSSHLRICPQRICMQSFFPWRHGQKH